MAQEELAPGFADAAFGREGDELVAFDRAARRRLPGFVCAAATSRGGFGRRLDAAASRAAAGLAFGCGRPRSLRGVGGLARGRLDAASRAAGRGSRLAQRRLGERRPLGRRGRRGCGAAPGRSSAATRRRGLDLARSPRVVETFRSSSVSRMRAAACATSSTSCARALLRARRPSARGLERALDGAADGLDGVGRARSPSCPSSSCPSWPWRESSLHARARARPSPPARRRRRAGAAARATRARAAARPAAARRRRRCSTTTAGCGATRASAADGAPLTIQSTGLGGPSTAIVVEELIALGARRFVRVGTCGRWPISRSARWWSPSACAARTGRAGRSAPARVLRAGPGAARRACTARASARRRSSSADLFYDPRPERRAGRRGASTWRRRRRVRRRRAAWRPAACVLVVSESPAGRIERGAGAPRWSSGASARVRWRLRPWRVRELRWVGKWRANAASVRGALTSDWAGADAGRLPLPYPAALTFAGSPRSRSPPTGAASRLRLRLRRHASSTSSRSCSRGTGAGASSAV